jgi:hypothetical protein
VRVSLNGRSGGASWLNVHPRTRFADFLSLLSERLSIDAKKVYDSTGTEFLDCLSLRENDSLFISSGEPFSMQQSDPHTPQDEKSHNNNGRRVTQSTSDSGMHKLVECISLHVKNFIKR